MLMDFSKKGVEFNYLNIQLENKLHKINFLIRLSNRQLNMSVNRLTYDSNIRDVKILKLCLK